MCMYETHTFLLAIHTARRPCPSFSPVKFGQSNSLADLEIGDDEESPEFPQHPRIVSMVFVL